MIEPTTASLGVSGDAITYLYVAGIVGVILVLFVVLRLPCLKEFLPKDSDRKIAGAILIGYGAVVSFGYNALKGQDDAKVAANKEQLDSLEAAFAKLDTASPGQSKILIRVIAKAGDSNSFLHRVAFSGLVGYVQDKTRNPAAISNTTRWANIGEEAQTALEVIGNRRLVLDDQTRAIDFRHLTMVQPDFHDLPGYQNTLFTGSAIYGADFRNAHLEGADFRGASMGDWQAYGNPPADAKNRRRRQIPVLVRQNSHGPIDLRKWPPDRLHL